jgi:pimeloyl-ACP methyl ester carboxylesterase
MLSIPIIIDTFLGLKDCVLSGNLLFGPNSFDGARAGKIAICIAGFNRRGTAEKKFQIIAEELEMPCCVFDYEGLGNSEGNASTFTVERATVNLMQVKQTLRHSGFAKFYAIAHSLGACLFDEPERLIAMTTFKEAPFKKIALLAPALNQKELLRYWFVNEELNNRNLPVGITSTNYRQYFFDFGGQESFLKWCKKPKEIGSREESVLYKPDYWLENMEADYTGLFLWDSKIFGSDIVCFFGEKDTVAPKEIAVSCPIPKKCIFTVVGADHDFSGKEEVVGSVIKSFFKS